jgi:hypothetical protein
MPSYYANRRHQPNGDTEVHTSQCHYFPKKGLYLGDFASCAPAVEQAKRYFVNPNGCAHCCPDCNTG